MLHINLLVPLRPALFCCPLYFCPSGGGGGSEIWGVQGASSPFQRAAFLVVGGWTPKVRQEKTQTEGWRGGGGALLGGSSTRGRTEGLPLPWTAQHPVRISEHGEVDGELFCTLGGGVGSDLYQPPPVWIDFQQTRRPKQGAQAKIRMRGGGGRGGGGEREPLPRPPGANSPQGESERRGFVHLRSGGGVRFPVPPCPRPPVLLATPRATVAPPAPTPTQAPPRALPSCLPGRQNIRVNMRQRNPYETKSMV